MYTYTHLYTIIHVLLIYSQLDMHAKAAGGVSAAGAAAAAHSKAPEREVGALHSSALQRPEALPAESTELAARRPASAPLVLHTRPHASNCGISGIKVEAGGARSAAASAVESGTTPQAAEACGGAAGGVAVVLLSQKKPPGLRLFQVWPMFTYARACSRMLTHAEFFVLHETFFVLNHTESGFLNVGGASRECGWFVMSLYMNLAMRP